MYQGSMVALVTPMARNGDVDNAALDKLIEFHIEQSTDAIVAVGTTGESATLNYDEHIGVIRQVVDRVNGRIPVIAGTGANSTQEAIELTQGAKGAGANACLLVTPYYNKPTQEGLYLHHKAIAEAVDIPQLLYNVPGRTACDMSVETTARLAEIDNIVGIKDATGDMERAQQILEACGDKLTLFSGDDATAMNQILLGGKGVISVTANVAPQAMHDLCNLAISGDADGAAEINERLVGLHKRLFLEANPIPVKWAVSKMGLIEEGIRLPLTWLSAQYHDDVLQAMEDAGVI
ncbi:MAG: 4-hydroxy-tetrahydrodipicolinate synthase [Gammaproteobacteria bacterium]|nr:MAG: 4-hydroxy-tetrahydrodipicolinate synthase [Gammaproteobacteria bacterium]